MDYKIKDEEIEGVVFGAKDLTPSGFVKAGAEAQYLKLAGTTDEELVDILAKGDYQFGLPSGYPSWEESDKTQKPFYRRKAKLLLSLIKPVINARIEQAKRETEKYHTPTMIPRKLGDMRPVDQNGFFMEEK